MTKKTKAPTNAGVTNELKLKFPQDTAGITPVMRREVARTIGRIKGDPKKMEIFKETYAILGDYAEAVYAKQVKAKKDAVAKAAAAAKAKEEASTIAGKQRAAVKRREADALNKEADVLEKLVVGNAK
tara:strand:+ start:311 stop:694 length:384 start_codon:yes stop_codon:yes gene_type:complete